VAYEPTSEADESLIVALPARMPSPSNPVEVRRDGKLVERVSIPGSGPGALDAAR
jgi:hypothetical protein